MTATFRRVIAVRQPAWMRLDDLDRALGVRTAYAKLECGHEIEVRDDEWGATRNPYGVVLGGFIADLVSAVTSGARVERACATCEIETEGGTSMEERKESAKPNGEDLAGAETTATPVAAETPPPDPEPTPPPPPSDPPPADPPPTE